MNRNEDEILRLVLVGGGHAHVQVLTSLAESPLPGVRVVLVVDHPVSIYSGMVPGFVAGQYSIEDLQIDLSPLAQRASAELLIGKVVGVEPARREIELDDGRRLTYSMASFNIGSTVAGLDVPGVREFSLQVRPIERFTREVKHLIDEARESTPVEPFSLVVVGAGAGGVELAFSLQHRLQRESAAPVEVTLIQKGAWILPGFPEALRKKVRRHSRVRNLTILCNQRVVEVRPEGVRLDSGKHISSRAVVWVAGPASQPIFARSGLPVDGLGFVRARTTLQVEGHDELLAAGDCATLVEAPEMPKAGVYAVRQGPILTHNIRALLSARSLRRFRPQKDFLALINLGDGTALGRKWGITVEGKWVMKLKDWIDRRWIRQFQNGSPDHGH